MMSQGTKEAFAHTWVNFPKYYIAKVAWCDVMRCACITAPTSAIG